MTPQDFPTNDGTDCCEAFKNLDWYKLMYKNIFDQVDGGKSIDMLQTYYPLSFNEEKQYAALGCIVKEARRRGLDADRSLIVADGYNSAFLQRLRIRQDNDGDHKPTPTHVYQKGFTKMPDYVAWANASRVDDPPKKKKVLRERVIDDLNEAKYVDITECHWCENYDQEQLTNFNQIAEEARANGWWARATLNVENKVLGPFVRKLVVAPNARMAPQTPIRRSCARDEGLVVSSCEDKVMAAEPKKMVYPGTVIQKDFDPTDTDVVAINGAKVTLDLLFSSLRNWWGW